jgi:hypothetical protein
VLYWLWAGSSTGHHQSVSLAYNVVGRIAGECGQKQERQTMILDSRQIIHMGINYHTVPMPAIDQQNNLRFQQFLLKTGVDITSGRIEQNSIVIERPAPRPLIIQMIVQAARPNIGQVLIVAPTSQQPLQQFINEVGAALDAFEQAWPSPNRQILACDVTLRCLYESTSDHAFQEIWEKRLSQPPDSLKALNRNVLGGGLRFVMPPQAGDPEPVQIELKIESFLRNTKKVFIETQFLWPGPKPPGAAFSPEDRLRQVNEYIEKHVHAFMRGDDS